MFRPCRFISNRPDPGRHVLKLVLVLLVTAVVLRSGQGEAHPFLIEDDNGRKIHVEQPFHRVVSLYGAHTENLFHLGLDTEIIGVSVNDRFPPQVADKPRFSFHDDAEKFIAARPDLVLIRPMIDNGYPALVRQLERHGITVVSLQPSDADAMFEYWRTLGRLTGRLDTAEQMVADFQQKVQKIRSHLPLHQDRKTVYFEAIHSRMKTFTPGAMAIYALESAGGINAAADARASRNTNIANFGKEKILARAYDIDVFLAQKGTMNPVTMDEILNEPGFHIIKAVKNHQVFLIDEKMVSRPVPRLIEGIMTIGKLLYPDIFTRIEKDL
jgi:iron complex transport system substrate-binding protein